MFTGKQLLIATLATLLAIVLLAIIPAVGAQGDLGGRVGVVDGLMGAFLMEIGALFQAKGTT